jgi:hypothetical protein
MALANFQTIFITLIIVLTSLVSAICSGWGKMSVDQEIQQAAKDGVEELNLSNRGLTSLPPKSVNSPVSKNCVLIVMS